MLKGGKKGGNTGGQPIRWGGPLLIKTLFQNEKGKDHISGEK